MGALALDPYFSPIMTNIFQEAAPPHDSNFSRQRADTEPPEFSPVLPH